MSEDEIEVVIPSHIKEMVTKLIADQQNDSDDERRSDYLNYVWGWLEASSEISYKELLKREGLPSDPRVIRLLCEIAVLRGLVEWHEVRDRPPPMPSVKSL